MSIRCLCVDDEPLARKGIRLALAPYKDFELIAECGSVDEVLESNHSSIDVIFLDIEMPRKNGMAMLTEWQGKLPLIVFVTAYNQYAVKAFEQQVLDYILKPIDEDRFVQVISRIRTQLAERQQALDSESLLKKLELLQQQMITDSKAISVKTDEGYFRLKVDEIIYLEAVGDHVCIHLNDKPLITRQTLKYFSAELADCGFYQVHKSYLVNAQQVIKATKLRFNDYQLTLSNHVNVRMSRRFKSALANIIP